MATKAYEPKSMKLRGIRLRISEANWLSRVSEARARHKSVEKILKRTASGLSQNEAIAAVVTSSKRSAALRDLKNFRDGGFEGLIDRRTPRDSDTPAWIKDTIEVARMANPSISVEAIAGILTSKYDASPSAATIKRILHSADLSRRAGRPSAESDAGEESVVVVANLEAAGFQLLQAAEAETEAVGQLVSTVLTVGQSLPEAGPVSSKEQALRNSKGQLTGKYNRARRKKNGEAIASYRRTTAEKAADLDLGRLSFRGQQPETIERKLWALLSLPALTPAGGRLEDLRGPQGRLLEEICGFEYQTETLRKAVSEFTLAGLGPALQQTQAATWHKVSVERWEHGYRAYVVYVDNNVKPLWTSMFTKSTKVSSTGRVQPALSSTFINTGVGVPIHFETHSGPAPLAPRVLDLLQQVEAQSEHPVGRLTVIDGECASANLLRTFKADDRDLVVPLPANMIKPDRFRYQQGSAFQPYRDGDQIREGSTTLQDSKDPGVSIEARAIIIQRRTKQTWTVLVSLASSEEWSAVGLAEAYFGRWPNQEGFFRQANQALGLKQIHGYGKRVVVNTAVLTELEQLDSRITQSSEKKSEEAEQLEETTLAVEGFQKQLDSATRRRRKRQERVDESIADESTHTRHFVTATTELRDAEKEEEQLTKKVKPLETKQDKLVQQIDKRTGKLAEWERKRTKLADRTHIIEADVAQDTFFTALKLTLGMLIQFIVVEYFPNNPFEWATFLSRIAMLPGRRETTTETLTIVIYGNRRDLKLMKAVDGAITQINKRNLIRDERRLRYKLEWPDGSPPDWAG